MEQHTHRTNKIITIIIFYMPLPIINYKPVGVCLSLAQPSDLELQTSNTNKTLLPMTMKQRMADYNST